MADICIITQYVEPSDQAGKAKITGQAIENSDDYLIGWEVHVSYNAEPSEINTAIIKAAMAEFANVGYTITANDKKTLFAAAS